MQRSPCNTFIAIKRKKYGGNSPIQDGLSKNILVGQISFDLVISLSIPDMGVDLLLGHATNVGLIARYEQLKLNVAGKYRIPRHGNFEVVHSPCNLHYSSIPD